MRKVALDSGAKKTTFCEVCAGQVVRRGTVTEVALRSWLGPDQPVAQVAIEACREAWHVHDLLRSWATRWCWSTRPGAGDWELVSTAARRISKYRLRH